MALRYYDNNAATAGFGTLGGSWTGSSPWTTNTAGTSLPAVFTFVSGDTAQFGFGSTTCTAGTFTIANAVTITLAKIVTDGTQLTTRQTIAATGTGRIVLAGTAAGFQVGTTGGLTISAPVGGTSGLEFTGGNTLTLTGTNTYSGTTSISTGVLQIGNAAALGTSTVTMTGGKLSSSSTTGYDTANALTLNGTMTLGDATNTGYLSFGGALTLAGNTTLTSVRPMFFNGAGTSGAAYNLTVTGTAGIGLYFRGGAGTFAGGTASFTNGFVDIANYNSGTPNQLAGFSTLTFNSDLQILGNTAHTFANAIGGTGIVYVRNTSASGITFNGSMASYTGSLRMYADSVEGANPVQKVTLTRADQFGFQSFWFQSDAGLTTLSQTLSYTGSGEVTNSKPLYIYGTSTSPTTIFSNDTSVAGTRVTFSNVVRTESAVTTNFRIATTTGPVTFSGVISNPNSGLINLTKTGSSYEATLSGANTFTGTVAVSQGTLNATTSATALGLATSTAGISVTSGATLSLGAAATYASRSLTIGGTGVSSTVGALVIANTGTSQFQSILLGSPTNYIRATSSGSINAPFTPNNNSVIFGASAGSSFVPFASLSNVFSGTGSVTYGSHSLDTGTVNADVRHTYTGNTTLAFGTTSVASAQELPGTGGPLGNKSLTAANTLLMTGGTLSYLNGNVDYSGRFSTVGGQQWRIAAGTATTFATALVGASSLRLFGGSLTLSSASSTFSGGVTLTEGTLYAGAAQSGVSGPLGITGTITFSPAGTGVLGYTAASAAFDYSSRFATTSGQSRRINANGESVTFSTAMGGDNELRLVGSAGTLTLAVANTYTQGTTLSVGTLKCGNAASLGTGGLAQANGTTLHVTATGGKLTIQGAHTNTGTGNRTIRIGA